MRLSEFILHEMESILVEWEAFADSCAPSEAKMSRRALRDHAEQILQAVAADLDTPQSASEQQAKAEGNAPRIPTAPETAAQTHAVLRAKSGFDINQLVSEYRALRASVVRLWTNSHHSSHTDFVDFIRFNEAIDQAIAESIDFFDNQLSKSRNLVLGMLGHDLRTPLGAVAAVADCLVQMNLNSELTEMGFILIRSSAAMQTLLNDLVDLNRTQLGLGISVTPSVCDLGPIFADELLMLRKAHADNLIDFRSDGDLIGYWDAARLQQLLRNLVVNAVKYGRPGSPVYVTLHGSDSDVLVKVTNCGKVIAPEAIHQIFEPLKRSSDSGMPSNLGLGLFIVKQIAAAHDGDVQVVSRDGETTFTVTLPRRQNVSSMH